MSRQQFISSSFKYREQDPSFVGQQLDQDYVKGPVQQRKCTDIFCCLLLLIVIGGMIFVGYLGFKTGKPSLLASPFDQDGNQCGVDKGYEDYQKIFISLNLQDSAAIDFVCVKSCPLKNDSIIQCKNSSKVKQCNELQIYQSKTVVNLCYPSQQIIKQLFDFDHFMSVTALQQCFSDLKQGWPLLAICVGLSFIVSILFTVFIHFCAGCFVWISIILFWLLMIGVGTLSFLIDRVEVLRQWVHYQSLPDNLKDRDYQLACAIICWSLAAIQFLVVCCFYRQIRVSIGILKASADFTREVCYAFFIPVFTTILQVLFLAAWFTTILYIFSSSESTIEPLDDTPFGFVQFNKNIQMYSILYLFGLFWIMFFFEALNDYWVCSSVAIWYFEQGEPRSPVYRSIRRSLKQVGSIAFGSLVVAIVVLIRVTLQYFTKVLKQKTLGLQQQVAPAKFALKCASCCIACFQRIIRFLTKNAYIMMAISGKNFCQSAKQSFYLMLRSTMQFAVSHGTTKIFIFFGKLMIVAICCISGYFALTSIQKYKTSIYSPTFLTILFGIVSYPVANAFMSLFEMASNTILMCYCLQLDLTKGGNPRCPVGLRNFLRNYMSQHSDYQR